MCSKKKERHSYFADNFSDLFPGKIQETLKSVEREILQGIANNKSYIRIYCIDQDLMSYIKEILEKELGYTVHITRSPSGIGSNSKCNEMYVSI